MTEQDRALNRAAATATEGLAALADGKAAGAAQAKIDEARKAIREALREERTPEPKTTNTDALSAFVTASDSGDLAAIRKAAEAVLADDMTPIDRVLAAKARGADASPGDVAHAAAEVERLDRDAYQDLAYKRAAFARGDTVTVMKGDVPEEVAAVEREEITRVEARIKAIRHLRRDLRASEPGTKPTAVTAITGNKPLPVLSIGDEHGTRAGALLSVGSVTVLAGAGGSSKTALALQACMNAAATQRGADRVFAGGGLVVAGGPALYVNYEMAPPILRDNAQALAATNPAVYSAAAQAGVHVLTLPNRPLFGPAEDESGRAGFYNQRPGPLEGWRDLWAAVAAIKPVMVVVDPVLAAYIGDSNTAAPVREFLTALGVEAEKHNTAVLLIAHSTKASRTDDDGIDPYDAGKIGGSGHWTDGARGAMSLTVDWNAAPPRYFLGVVKANYGPQRVYVAMHAHPDGSGPVVALEADPADPDAYRGAWQKGKPTTAAGARQKCAGTKPNGDPCKAFAVKGGDYCAHHVDQAGAGANGTATAKAKANDAALAAAGGAVDV